MKNMKNGEREITDRAVRFAWRDRFEFENA
jgi:hypothetical protein